MNAFMSSIFGVSWRTTLAGWIQFLFVTAFDVFQNMSGGKPFDFATFDWKTFSGSLVLAIALHFAKDKQVSNSPQPVAAQAVSPETKT